MKINRRNIIKKFRSYIYIIANNYEMNKIEKRGRPNKFKLHYYIKHIIKVLIYGYAWENLECTCDVSTIRKKFYKWRDNEIFYKAYQLCIEYYIDSTEIVNLHIDATVIGNENCQECIGYTYKLKSKKAIKINSIVTDDRITISHIISTPSNHDVYFIEPCVEQLNDKLNATYHNPIYVNGDKGYTSKEIKIKLKDKNYILVYPRKKNAISKENYKYRNKLKNRFKVEVSYAHTKKRYKRIKIPTDKKILNYNVFYMLSLVMDILRHLSIKRQYAKFNKLLSDTLKTPIDYSNYNPYIHIEY